MMLMFLFLVQTNSGLEASLTQYQETAITSLSDIGSHAQMTQEYIYQINEGRGGDEDEREDKINARRFELEDRIQAKLSKLDELQQDVMEALEGKDKALAEMEKLHASVTSGMERLKSSQKPQADAEKAMDRVQQGIKKVMSLLNEE